jgi:type I restriction enzyme S subunit
MELRPGYKRTEVGIIPEDWKVRPIRAVCRLVNGRGFKPFEWRRTGLPIIRIQNLNGSDDFNHFSGPYDRKLEVEPGQLLFAWSGSRGTSFGPHIWPGPLGLLNYHTWKLQIHESEVVKGFFFYALRQLTAFIEGRAHGASALVHTQKWEMEDFEFPFPPDKAEQEAIAEALGDVDVLIESVEQLIVKKRRLKQGVMEELLTGKRRLSGFELNAGHKQTEVGVAPIDWHVAKLGALCSMKSGEGITSGEINQFSGYACYGGNGFRGFAARYTHDGRYTLIGRQGALCGNVLGVEGKFFASEHAIVVTASARTDSRWLTFKLGEMRLNKYSESSAQPGLSVSRLLSLDLVAPSAKAEQEAIATTLSAMDSEIAALDAKLLKARALKQGMMRELLTGRVRLV